RALADDRDGNLWLGTAYGGAYKIAREMIVSYTRAQGLPATTAIGVFEDHAGQVKAVANNSEIVTIAGNKIIGHQRPDLPAYATNPVSFLLDQAQKIQGSVKPFLYLGYTKPIIRLANGREINIANLIHPIDWGGEIFAYEDET